jgi:pyruvate/2-oxoglutarate dehydrogenase complex dihydrolipoamide dehydrogenase (E3) component
LKRYHVVVIGGGAGGLTVAAGAAGLGAKVALIDKGKLGGDCLWTGCVPSKALIQSAKIVHMARKAETFGLKIEGKAEFSEAKRRIDESIAVLQKHDDPDRFRKMGVDVYTGTARLLDKHRVSIDENTVVFGKGIVIATGSSPNIPPIPGLKDIPFLTNETIFELEEAPSSLLVMGGGPIGLELAQSFARFGTKVTVIEMADRLLAKEEPELVPYVQKSLERDGITFMLGSKVTSAAMKPSEIELTVEAADGRQISINGAKLLVSTGRKPNTNGLGLEDAGVELNRGSIPVNAQLRTSIDHIFAVGDVNGTYPFTHAAGEEGKIVVSNALFGLKRKMSYKAFPWVTYTDPELFHLGMTEAEARENMKEIRVFETNLADVDRFVADHEADGRIKVITDAKGHILGAHAVGIGAGEFMQEMVYAAAIGKKIGTISQVVHPYPTRVGALQKTADQYWRQRLFKGWLPKVFQWYLQRWNSL